MDLIKIISEGGMEKEFINRIVLPNSDDNNNGGAGENQVSQGNKEASK